jgi:RNA polymerase sigma-70 factor (ECF subfamily)
MTPDRTEDGHHRDARAGGRTISHVKLLSDEDLMERCVEDSEEAFRTLVERYKSRMLNVITRYIGDRERAYDLTQEVFMRVFIHRRRYRRSGKFSTWIYTIAVNLAKNEIRRKVRLNKVIPVDTVTEMNEAGTIYLTDTAPGADEAVAQRDLSRVVREAIDRLPAKYREVLILRDIQDLSYTEIGEILGIPGGTVRSRINRARLALKDKITPYIKRSGYEV